MYKVGIDLGGTNIKAGIVDAQYHIVKQASVPTQAERTYQEIVKDMAMLVKHLMEETGICEEEVEGIGIGSPGMIDAKEGVVVYSNNIRWDNVPLVQEMNSYFSCPVKISNDANCAALGEAKAGAAKGVPNVILLTLGTGVGGGIVVDGKLFEGGHAGGAELGHTMLVAGGEECTCGRRGCIEAYASATALIKEATRKALIHPESMMNILCKNDINNMNGKIPFDAAQAGDKAGKEVIDRYIRYLGESIADFVNIFRPDVVLLSGGVCNQGEKLTEPLNQYIKDKCFGGEKSFIPPVRCATLGNNAGIIGAASLI
ncbi:MAG: ROK family protein [Lachnospiraceae bacterium]|nr:ROK family protein [Lachnospiraceae bacterium]